ncbi:MAG: hypothetical protein AB7Q29_19470 [Vicinamibacterales bacterium]
MPSRVYRTAALKANENHITIAREKAKSHGLGVFIRSLVGLDRKAAKQAFSQFLSGGTASPSPCS